MFRRDWTQKRKLRTRPFGSLRTPFERRPECPSSLIRTNVGPARPLPETKTKGAAKKVDQAKLKKDLAKASTDTKRKYSSAIRTLDQSVNEFNGYLAVQEERYEDALALFKKSYGISTGYKAEITLLAGKTDEAVKAGHRRREVASESDDSAGRFD